MIHTLTTYLNSVSYEEIVIASLKGLESIVPVDGMVAVEKGFSVSPLTFSETAPTTVPTPCRFNRGRARLV